jgi:hypothetical protein
MKEDVLRCVETDLNDAVLRTLRICIHTRIVILGSGMCALAEVKTMYGA